MLQKQRHLGFTGNLERVQPNHILWVGLLLGTYALTVLYTHFLSGSFGFHDLTMISDFLANTAYGRGFFFVPDYGLSHFKIHFTPTLILLAPLFRLFDSQATLLFLNVVFLYFSFFLFVSIQKVILALSFPVLKERVPTSVLHAVPILFFVLLALNRYSKNVLFSASCWFPYLTLSAGLMLAILRNYSWPVILMLLVLTLGVRQDVGLFLSFQLAALVFLPRPTKDLQTTLNTNSIRRKLVVASVLAFLTTLSLSLWVLPRLGAASHIDRGWGHYGASWAEVGISMLTHPLRVLEDIFQSAFLSFNTSLFWFAAFNPILFFMNNAPGALFYICTDPAKKYLWYYNSGFLLPGLFVATGVGMWRILEWGTAGAHFLTSRRYRLVLLLFLSILPISLLTLRDANTLKYIPSFADPDKMALNDRVLSALKECPGVRSAAADFRTIVYLPNSLTRLRLNHYAEADLVFIVPPLTDEPGNFIESVSAETVISADSHFHKVSQNAGLNVYLRNGVSCARQ